MTDFCVTEFLLQYQVNPIYKKLSLSSFLNELKVLWNINQISIKNLNGIFTIELLINSNSLLPKTSP